MPPDKRRILLWSCVYPPGLCGRVVDDAAVVPEALRGSRRSPDYLLWSWLVGSVASAGADMSLQPVDSEVEGMVHALLEEHDQNVLPVRIPIKVVLQAEHSIGG